MNTVEYRSVDHAGNVEEATTLEIELDRTAPITTTNDISSGTYKEEVEVILTAEDEISGVTKTEYRINGGECQEYTEAWETQGRFS